MILNTYSPLKVLSFCICLFLGFSCSKDSDLLSEYVLADSDGALELRRFIVDDFYTYSSNNSIILDVLENDQFEEGDTVEIIETSDPENGEVSINENNTITYTPDATSETPESSSDTNTPEIDNETSDTFTYTTEVVEENGTVTTEIGNVVLNVALKVEVAKWKQKFDEEWNRAKDYYIEQTTGPEKGNQRRYYDFRVIDGLIYMFQATGDMKYMNDFFWYVDRIKSEARPSTYHNDSYYDWEVPYNGDLVAFQLYDGHGLRNIFKMLWLLKKYPEVRSQSNFQEKYDEYLIWFKENLWDKWESRGPNEIMRSNTHMASHMASNMALYLYLLEENPVKKKEYLSWINSFNNNIHSKWTKYDGSKPNGFRGQLRVDSPHDGYVWAGPWGSMSRSNDITHTNAEVQSVVNQFHQGIEWTEEDIQLFLNTLNNVLDKASKPDFSDIPFFIDLTTNSTRVKTLSYGWAMLGRFDENTQLRLKNFSVSRNQASYYHNIYLGIMAFNRAYLDGNLIYPEF